MADEPTNPNNNNNNGVEQQQHSEMTNEAIIHSIDRSNSESSVKIPDTSTVTNEKDEKSLEYADELMEKGNAAFNEDDFPDAADLFSQALEIRVAHYGELAPQCIHSYYKYGQALLYKAQEEADPFGSVPKTDAESREGSVQVESAKNKVEGESSIASASSNVEQCASSSHQHGPDDGPSNPEEDKDESDTEEHGEGEEDESELDLAWKMLDVARAISEKHSKDSMEMVNILSALAEVSLEREEIETSLSDYQKALSILENLVEPDSRRIAELNFRICLCLEVGSRAQEAIPYCEKALSVCKLRMQRLSDEMKSTSVSAAISTASEAVQGDSHSSVTTQSENPGSDKKSEIEGLTGLCSDLEKKLEDLQQLLSHPSSIMSDILGLVAAKAKAKEQADASGAASSSRVGVSANNGDFDSPTVSTAHTNGNTGVTHLGVVGRGVKRVNMNQSPVESSATKKPALDPKPDVDGSSGS